MYTTFQYNIHSWLEVEVESWQSIALKPERGLKDVTEGQDLKDGAHISITSLRKVA